MWMRYIIFFKEGISKTEFSNASSFINLEPLITVYFSVYFLKKITIHQWAGATIIVSGVLLSNKRRNKS
ncbi:TPA: EamA family transporter [Salmonella enterica subsp. enterica serovar Birkenhead]|jgi:drug/metabolite transporter (DMT)-like permease